MRKTEHRPAKAWNTVTKIGLSLVSLRARCLFGGVALMSATLVCGPAHAESTDSPMPLFVGPAVTRSGGTDFSAARAASEQAFVDALPGARARAALDHAQFLISWMMLPEAQSYVDFAANALEARGELADRIQAYRAMLALLSQPGMQPETVAFPDSWQNDLVWPIVAEIQVRLRSVLPLTLSSHKLYEVVRAESIAALAGAGRSITINQVMDETEALKAKDAELAAMGAELAALRADARVRHASPNLRFAIAGACCADDPDPGTDPSAPFRAERQALHRIGNAMAEFIEAH